MGLSGGCLGSMFSDIELTDGTVEQVVTEQLGVVGEDLERAKGYFVEMILKDRMKEDVAVRAWAGLPTWEVAKRIAKRAAAEEWAEEEHRFDRARASVRRIQAAVPPPPARTTAVTRRQRAFDGDPQGRRRGEEAERGRWIGELGKLLEASGVALLNPEWDGLSRASIVSLLAGGRRASTLRARARAWKNFQGYLRLTTGASHPRSAYEALDYVLARAAEPCSKSVLMNVKALFSFIDSVTGEIPSISGNRYVAAALREKLALAPARRDGDHSPASRYPVAMLGLMEEALVGTGLPPYSKVLVWWTLMSCWCTLRFDDHRGLTMDAFRVSGDGVTFELSRSKTTGEDKAVRLRPVFLSSDAFLKERDWFVCGWKLYKSMSEFDRDYLLCAPTSDMLSVMPRELTHGEFTARLRGIIAGLQVDGVALGVDVASHFTPHSGRNFLPSAAVGLGASEDDVRKLGAWSVRGGAAYVRTVREHTARVQEVAGRFIRRSKDGADAVADAAAVEDLARHLESRGTDKEDISRVTRALTWSTAGPASRLEAPLSRCMPIDDDALGGHSRTAGAASSTEASSTDRVGVGSADADDDISGYDISGYVCSVIGRSRVRRLHYIGLCHRRPGHDYTNYEVHGRVMPSPSNYDAICRKCWPNGDPSDVSQANHGESSVSTSDESSSSDDS